MKGNRDVDKAQMPWHGYLLEEAQMSPGKEFPTYKQPSCLSAKGKTHVCCILKKKKIIKIMFFISDLPSSGKFLSKQFH